MSFQCGPFQTPAFQAVCEDNPLITPGYYPFPRGRTPIEIEDECLDDDCAPIQKSISGDDISVPADIISAMERAMEAAFAVRAERDFGNVTIEERAKLADNFRRQYWDRALKLLLTEH